MATIPNIPTTESQRREFQAELTRLSYYEIGDKRYTDWGMPFDPKSNWKIREANRYLTELDRRRELRPVVFAVWVGVFTLLVAILATPLDHSVLAETLNDEVLALHIMQFVVLMFLLVAFAFFSYEATISIRRWKRRRAR